MIYNIKTDKIEKLQPIIKIDGATMYSNKLSEEELNKGGFYKVKYENKPDMRYYDFTENKTLINNTYIVSYTKIDKPIEDIQYTMLKELGKDFIKYSERPRVTIPELNIVVDGGRADKDNFKELWEDMIDEDTTSIKDADNQFHHNLSKSDVYIIYKSIVKKGRNLMQLKWTKEQEIKSLNTVAECINYEDTLKEWF